MIIEKPIADLQQLATLCDEQADHLNHDAVRADSDALTVLFEQLANDMDSLKESLEQHIRVLGELPRPASEEQETLRDAVSMVKTAFVEDADNELLLERLQQYRVIAAQTERVLSNENLPESVTDTAEDVVEIVLKHQCKLKKMQQA